MHCSHQDRLKSDAGNRVGMRLRHIHSTTAVVKVDVNVAHSVVDMLMNMKIRTTAQRPSERRHAERNDHQGHTKLQPTSHALRNCNSQRKYTSPNHNKRSSV